MTFNQAEDIAIKMVAAGSRLPDGRQLIDIHKTLIGDKPARWYCATCSGKLDAIFTDLCLKYFQHTKKIKPANVMAKNQKSTNYRFTAASKKAGVHEITIVDGEHTLVVTPQNLTDRTAKLVLAQPQFAHNIEEIGGEEEGEEEDSENKSDILEVVENVGEAKRGRPKKEQE